MDNFYVVISLICGSIIVILLCNYYFQLKTNIMASYKAILFSGTIILLMAQCQQSTNTTTTIQKQTLPQMSKEDGKIITSREISVWEYSKTKQLDKLREILADDYVGYFVTGNMQPSDVINLLRKSTFTSYHLSNINVKPITENVAIITYHVLQDVTGAEGDKWIPEIAASATYVKRNGVWYSVFYQEMPLL